MLSGTLLNSNKFHPLKKITIAQCWHFQKTPANKNKLTFQQMITLFIGYFPSPSVCHKNVRFCRKLLYTSIYSLKLAKLIFFFQQKKWKREFVITDIYQKIYRYTPIYLTPIYRYKFIDISNTKYWYFRYIDIILPWFWGGRGGRSSRFQPDIRMPDWASLFSILIWQ